MKAARLFRIGDFRIQEVEKPKPKGNEILIKIGACGICGSDLPRVYQLGTRTYPVTLGHEFSGIVAEVGNSVDRELIGKKVAVFPLIPCGKCVMCRIGRYCQCHNYGYLGSRSDGGFAEYCLVPSRWHLIIPDNENIPLDNLCMTEPACVAQHAVRRGNISAGECVVILGAGPIGILTARWARIFGARDVILTDIDRKKVAFAKERGFKVINSIEEDSVAEIMALANGKGADVVIEGTGSSEGVNCAIECARMGGRIVMLGNPHSDTRIELKNHSAILRKELTVLGVWNSYYEEIPVNEWEYTVHMMGKGVLQVSDLITHRSNLVGLKSLFEQIHKKEISICKAIYDAEIGA